MKKIVPLIQKIRIIRLPKFPEDVDWGLKLIYEGPQGKKEIE